MVDSNKVIFVFNSDKFYGRKIRRNTIMFVDVCEYAHAHVPLLWVINISAGREKYDKKNFIFF